jgi:hypothetical protein
MKAAELERLKALEAEATAGPWEAGKSHPGQYNGRAANITGAGEECVAAAWIWLAEDEQEALANAELLPAMRNALPALLREREELLKALRALRAAHTDRDSHCEICPALMDAAIAKAES